MNSKIVKRSLFSIFAVALISIVIWGLADEKTDATVVVLAVINMAITTCIWFSFAWKAFETKPRDALPAFAICLLPYLFTAGIDKYMEPYYYNGGGNVWASILDGYGNILFHSTYNLLASVSRESIITVSYIILLMQILLPMVLAFIIRFSERFALKNRWGL